MAWARVFLALASEPTPATDNASAGTAATTAGGEAVAATAGWRLSLESLTAAKATESEVGEKRNVCFARCVCMWWVAMVVVEMTDLPSFFGVNEGTSLIFLICNLATFPLVAVHTR